LARFRKASGMAKAHSTMRMAAGILEAG